MRVHLQIYIGGGRLGEVVFDYVGPSTDPKEIREGISTALVRGGILGGLGSMRERKP
ncbi:MAG: hypothetical protein ACREDE_11005 [Thermoplasmata archaeon]